MVALFSPLFSSFGWPLEEDFNQYNYCQPQIEPTISDSFGGDDRVLLAKKFNHNASERDRRKRINALYSTLRSLLPPSDQTMKLSISATVSRVVRYIPELQKEMGKLVEKKEGLLSSSANCRKQQKDHFEKPIIREIVGHDDLDSSVVSTTWICDTEILIHISVLLLNSCSFSQILQVVEEEEGLHLLNVSSFQPFGDRLFYNLHLQVHGYDEQKKKMKIEMLREKLVAFILQGHIS